MINRIISNGHCTTALHSYDNNFSYLMTLDIMKFDNNQRLKSKNHATFFYL